MIDRYTLPEMGALWSEQNKFQKWLDVEIAVCEVHAEMGTIPREALGEIKSRARFSVERINEIEKTTNHDVIAFTTNLAESIGDASRFVHYGLTSSDVVDTANALLLRDSADIILKKIDALLEALKKRAFEFKATPQVGRTHGIHAEPTSFGLTFALWFDEMRRNRERLMRAKEATAVGKISGAVGAFAHLDPQVEEQVCARLGLKAAPVSTQIIQRDVYAEYLSTLAIIASSLDKFALNIRHWQRTEVREAQEKFAGETIAARGVGNRLRCIDGKTAGRTFQPAAERRQESGALREVGGRFAIQGPPECLGVHGGEAVHFVG